MKNIGKLKGWVPDIRHTDPKPEDDELGDDAKTIEDILHEIEVNGFFRCTSTSIPLSPLAEERLQNRLDRERRRV